MNTLEFQRMEVYGKTKVLCKTISDLIEIAALDKIAKYQLRKSSINILMNIAEGAARPCVTDKVRFLVISRGSAFECLALLEHLRDNRQISPKLFQSNFIRITEVSNMLQLLVKQISETIKQKVITS